MTTVRYVNHNYFYNSMTCERDNKNFIVSNLKHNYVGICNFKNKKQVLSLRVEKKKI